MNCRVILSLTLVVGFLSGCKSDAENRATKSYLDDDWPQVVENAKKWVSEDPDNPVPHALLNIAYTKFEKHRENKLEVKSAYGSSERVAKVSKWALSLVNANKDNPRAYLINGIVNEHAGCDQEAVAAYEKAIAIDPLFKQGYQCLGNYFLANGQSDKALSVYLILLEKCPSYGPVYGNIALVYVVKNEMPVAVGYFEKSVELDPKDATAFYNLSGAYLEVGAKDKAVIALRKVVELDPDGEVGDDARRKLAKFGRSEK